jgi:lambda family phage portal protein
MVVDDYQKFIAAGEERLERMRNAKAAADSAKTISVEDMPQASSDVFSNAVSATWDGDKYPTGFGDTVLYDVDYYTLRARSRQLFTENLYARGVIRRLVTNIINVGLTLEVMPDELTLGMEPDSLTEWSEQLENKFYIWGGDPQNIDVKGQSTWGGIQEQIEIEALVAGDVLVVLKIDEKTGLPKIKLVAGDRIQDPPKIKNGANKIKHGVELDADGKHVAFYVSPEDDDENGKFVRIPARGKKTGRLMAWLVYGTDKLIDDVRGQCLLSLMMQGLKEIDRFRDASQRKATINSIFSASVEKTEDKAGSQPIRTMASRTQSGTVEDGGAGGSRRFNVADLLPGAVIEEMQQGERLVVHQSGADINFGPFEQAILAGVAWANEIPPEILLLSFNSNYSASQAALNEFKMFLGMKRKKRGDQYCQRYYVEWLISYTLIGGVDAPGLLESWRDPKKWATFGAWTRAEWIGAIKPTTDPVKQSKAAEMQVANAWTTNTAVAIEINGSKWRENVKKLKRENEQLVLALRPMLELKAEFGEQQTDDALDALGRSIDEIEARFDDREEEN